MIGALGVLDDLTVSPASTVMALRRANPSLDFTGLFREAIAVGQDHVAATVNTLVLAYAGASLPVLLIFSLGSTGFSDAVNSEAVATEIIATLVGSVGLIAAVPLTTALAAVLVSRMSPTNLPADAHGHAIEDGIESAEVDGLEFVERTGGSTSQDSSAKRYLRSSRSRLRLRQQNVQKMSVRTEISSL